MAKTQKTLNFQTLYIVYIYWLEIVDKLNFKKIRSTGLEVATTISFFFFFFFWKNHRRTLTGKTEKYVSNCFPLIFLHQI